MELIKIKKKTFIKFITIHTLTLFILFFTSTRYFFYLMSKKATVSGIPDGHIFSLYIYDLKTDMNLILLFTLALAALITLAATYSIYIKKAQSFSKDKD